MLCLNNLIQYGNIHFVSAYENVYDSNNESTSMYLMFKLTIDKEV